MNEITTQRLHSRPKVSTLWSRDDFRIIIPNNRYGNGFVWKSGTLMQALVIGMMELFTTRIFSSFGVIIVVKTVQ